MEYRKQLKLIDETRASLARILGLSESGVYRWGDCPPRYAREYLDVRVRLAELERYKVRHDRLAMRVQNAVDDHRGVPKEVR